MKRTAIANMILIIMVAMILFLAGFASGVRHAICDSSIWTVDVYNPDDPDASEWNGFDQLIYIELDGQLYEHGMYQG